MNTNNVYCAEVYRLIKTEISGGNILELVKCYKASFSRDTLVYQKQDGRFYDLLGKKYLKCAFDLCDEIGTEIINVERLIPFNTQVNQTKDNLSRSKIKKLYVEYKK